MKQKEQQTEQTVAIKSYTPTDFITPINERYPPVPRYLPVCQKQAKRTSIPSSQLTKGNLDTSQYQTSANIYSS